MIVQQTIFVVLLMMVVVGTPKNTTGNTNMSTTAGVTEATKSTESAPNATGNDSTADSNSTTRATTASLPITKTSTGPTRPKSTKMHFYEGEPQPDNYLEKILVTAISVVVVVPSVCLILCCIKAACEVRKTKNVGVLGSGAMIVTDSELQT